MYDELIRRLRVNGELFQKYIPNAEGEILLQAADAIEELQKRVPKRPHGRLIDADEFKLYLTKMLIKYAPAFKTDEYAHFAVQLTEAIASDIDEAPTIIPAEEGET